MKDLVFCCGSCGWYKELTFPEGVKLPDDYTPRGYCYHNPPSVFPMPKQTQTLAAMGQPRLSTVPYMMRPIVESVDKSCGFYTPIPEALSVIQEMDNPVMEARSSKKDCCDDSECCNREGNEGCDCPGK